MGDSFTGHQRGHTVLDYAGERREDQNGAHVGIGDQERALQHCERGEGSNSRAGVNTPREPEAQSAVRGADLAARVSVK